MADATDVLSETLMALRNALELGPTEPETDDELWFEAGKDTIVVVRRLTGQSGLKIEAYPGEARDYVDPLGLLITNEMMAESGGPQFGVDPVEGAYHAYSIVDIGDTPAPELVIDAVEQTVNLLRHYDPADPVAEEDTRPPPGALV